MSVAVRQITGTLDEGPAEAFVGRAQGLVQHHAPVPGTLLVSVPGPGPGELLQGPAVRALHADAPARVTGVPAPAALHLTQAVPARPQA